MKKFAYVFALNGKCVWSGETAATVERRANNDKDRAEIAEFVELGQPGHFITLDTGEMIFCTEAPEAS